MKITVWQINQGLSSTPLILRLHPITVRRRKLIAKIDEQIQLAADKDYTPTQYKWVTVQMVTKRRLK